MSEIKVLLLAKNFAFSIKHLKTRVIEYSLFCIYCEVRKSEGKKKNDSRSHWETILGIEFCFPS